MDPVDMDVPVIDLSPLFDVDEGRRLNVVLRLPQPPEWTSRRGVWEPPGPGQSRCSALLEGVEPPAFWSVGKAMGSPAGQFVL